MSERKDTNPKDAIGIAKVPASTVPREVMAEVGLAMMEGALKYGRHNYREAGVRASVYYDAFTRHVDAFWEGQDIDPDSGLSHLVKAIACLVVLRDSQFRGNWVDDRPPSLPDNWQADLNVKAAALLEKYPNPVPAHVELKVVDTDDREPPLTIKSLDEANIDYVWTGGGFHYRFITEWEMNSTRNVLKDGWIPLGDYVAESPLSRGVRVEETYSEPVPRVWQSLADVPVGVRVTHTADDDTICVTRAGYAWFVQKGDPFPGENDGWPISYRDDYQAPFTEVLET